MLKFVTAALLLVCVATLAACESAAVPRTAAASGTQLGDSGVSVSGTLQAGGSASIR